MELGEVVYSKAGRDSKSYYIVVEIVNENAVKIADGGLTKVFNPEIDSALKEYNDKK